MRSLGSRAGLARQLVRLASVLVPRRRRADWLEEWHSELKSLERAGEGPSLSRDRPPSPLEFALGSLPYALWTLKEEWTMDGVLHDLRYASRILRRSPGFTLVAALTLALGIGANASIFSLVNGLMIRAPAGITKPERLVQIARSYEDAPRWDNLSWPALSMIRREARTLSGVAGYQNAAFVLGRGREVERVPGAYVTGDFFQVLGVRPSLGRLIQPSDDAEPEGHPVVVLSHSLWERRFGGDPSVVGKTVAIGTVPYEVLGVAPAGFAGSEAVSTPPALWVPAAMRPASHGELPFGEWGWSWISAVGRLADGVSLQEARASMRVVSARLREADPVNEGIEILLAPGVGLDPDGRREAGQMSALLFAIVGLVLLLTCANVANLFLARAAARRKEVGVRMALGAGRGRLVRQLVTESVFLSVLATLFSLPLVLAGGWLIPAVFPYDLTVSVAPDYRVFLFLLAVGIGAGILFGLAPAWVSSRRNLAKALRAGASTGGDVRTLLRDGLVVFQLALSLGLVAGAGLLGQSVRNAAEARPGFLPGGLTAGFVDLGGTGRYDETSNDRILERLLDAAERVPGVRSATLSNQAPIVGGHSRRTIRPSGRDDVEFEAESVVVGPGYFETLGIPILGGRALGGLEDEERQAVAVNETLAKMFWPGEDPVGKELQGNPPLRVVGLVGDVQMRSLRSRALPAVYYPMPPTYSDQLAIQVRTEGGQAVSPVAMREAVAEVDPELPVALVVDLQASLVASMGETRTIAFLIGSFAFLALVLAGVGLYGLVSFGAVRRVKELGIRMALGAQPRSLTRLVLVRGLTVSAAGVGMGMAAAWAMGRLLRRLLFDVRATDPPTLGGAAILLLAIAGLAAWIPARRAARVDAAVSLRQE